MSEEQTIMYPEVCLGCKSKRIGVQEGEATYECGTSIKINYKLRTLTAERSQQCLQGAPHGK
jgi:hypothetical protein